MNLPAGYLPIGVETARDIAVQFSKSIVAIVAWDDSHQLLHTTTFGWSPQDKLDAARLGEILNLAAGGDPSDRHSFEDFRELDPAKAKARIDELTLALRDMANQLEDWARESAVGGWSTHQVDPMRRKADQLRRLAR